jgi:hypothetical protein
VTPALFEGLFGKYTPNLAPRFCKLGTRKYLYHFTEKEYKQRTYPVAEKSKINFGGFKKNSRFISFSQISSYEASKCKKERGPN